MPTPADFNEIYTDELKNLWSANDKMQKVLKKMDTTKEIYGGDEYMTKLAETSVNLQAEDA